MLSIMAIPDIEILQVWSLRAQAVRLGVRLKVLK